MTDHNWTKKDLKRLRAEFPLPKNVPDATMNMTELSQFLEVSMNTLSKYVRAGMPAQQIGGEGREYQFRAADCWAWRQSRESAEQQRSDEADAAIRAMRSELIDSGRGGESIMGLAPRERREIIQVQMVHEQFERSRNQLIQREEVVALLEDVFTVTRDGVESIPDTLVRECGIGPREAEKVADKADFILTEIRAKIIDFFEERPVNNSVRSRTDLFETLQ